MTAKILIAEDDPNIRLGLVATLESEGYGVTAAGDGAQALKLFPQEKFDLVILDVMMPKASGYEVCRALRAQGARVPILFLTAKGEEIDKVVGLKIGADDYVTKPFGVHELLARVEAREGPPLVVQRLPLVLLARVLARVLAGGSGGGVAAGVPDGGGGNRPPEIYGDGGGAHERSHGARAAARRGAGGASGRSADPGRAAQRGMGRRLLRHHAHARPARGATAEKGRGGAG